ncbi:hypothetical protein CEW87_21415 [Parazoarcus communis]|uniref:Uncharacterized protein n=2 Tax=Parazoarcus communis TaxID=41977 RepID=A0A2U8H6V1_9RHOO|nr:hypothetical protein CEW87_21415 [Parazoarcus communis]
MNGRTSALITTVATLTALCASLAQALGEEEELSSVMAGDGVTSIMDVTSVATRQGFHPANCSRHEVPPAELLALADWPLDDTPTCTQGRAVARAAPVVEATIRPIRAMAEVVEASILTPREVLDRYGDTPGTLATTAPDTGKLSARGELNGNDGNIGAAVTAAPASLASAAAPAPARAQAPAPVAVASAVMDQTAGELPVAIPPLAKADKAEREIYRPLPSTLMLRRAIRLAEAPAVAESELDALRGGFETPSGLRVSFGIERAVYVNGVLSSVTSVNLADLGNMNGRGLPEGSTLAVIQNGPNNAFISSGLNNNALATVIQNSLDNQNIRAVTTINASVNSVEMLRSAHMNTSMRDVMVQSLLR